MAELPLIGRRRELEELLRAFERALHGHGQVRLLAGDPGMGKTRLAEELSLVAGERGANVHWGRAWEVEGAPPLAPWVEVLRGLSGAPGEAELEPLSQGDPFQLAASVLRLLERAAARTVRVLVLDDLHSADLATLALLHSVARQARRLRVLILCTYREIEVRQSPERAAVLAKIAREGLVLPLGPLASEEVRALVRATVGSAPEEVQRAIIAASEGNPLFADALARLWASRGDAFGPPIELPDSIRETILRRAAVLSVAHRALLEIGATFGRAFSQVALAEAAGRPPREVCEAIDVGVAAGLLRRSGVDEVVFSHVLVREALYQRIRGEDAVALHGRCGEVLERSAPDALEVRAAELAHHFAMARAPRRARGHALRAGQRGLALFAYDEARGHLERAVLWSSSEPERAEALSFLGEAQIRAGQARAGKESCLKALKLAEEVGDPALYARTALALGAELIPGFQNPELAELLARALALIDERAPGLRAQLKARRAAALIPSGDPFAAHALAREAIAEARALGDRPRLARVLATARSVFTPADPLEERFAWDEELAALGAELGAKDVELQARSRLLLDALERGDGARARAEGAQYERLATAARLPQHEWRAPVFRMLFAAMELDDEAFERAGADAAEILGEQDFGPERWLVVGAQRFFRARLRGDTRELVQVAADLAALPLDAVPPNRRFWPTLFRAVAEGSPPPLSDWRGPPNPGLLALVAEPHLRAGDRQALAALFERLLPAKGSCLVATAILCCDGPASLHLGRIALALGQHERARELLREAVVEAVRLGSAAHQRWAERVLAGLGAGPAPTAAAPSPRLVREGDLWTVSWGAEVVRVKHNKGMVFLSALLEEPGREHHVLALAGEGEGGSAPQAEAGLSEGGLGNAGELLDAKARASYRARIEALDDELEEADRFGDPGRRVRAEEERAALVEELARAVGLGGRSRKAADVAERARVNVQRRLKEAIRKICEVAPALGRHLELRVKTGTYCSYQPG